MKSMIRYWPWAALVALATAYVMHHASGGPELPWGVHPGTLVLVLASCWLGVRALVRTLGWQTVRWDARPSLEIVRRLSAVIDALDPFSRGRSYRISMACVRVGRELGLPEDELEDLELAALLHDVGRNAIQHDVLLKRGSLSDTERAEIQSHPLVSYELVKDVPGFAHVGEIIYAHHEQPDGKGYPRGISRTQIPMGARVIMVLAAFDAMTSDRPYRLGLSVEDAYKELREHSGSMFFPTVVEVFIELHQAGRLYEDVDPEEWESISGAQIESLAPGTSAQADPENA